MPLKETKKSAKKAKKNQKEAKIQEELTQEEAMAQQLFDYFCQSIDNASKDIMRRKYKKINDLIVQSLTKLIRK